MGVCGLCSKRTEELQCPTCANPNKVVSFSASSTEIVAGEPVTFSWSASGCILDATISIGSKTFTFKDVSSGSAVWTGTDADDNITEPKKYQATFTISSDCCGGDTKTIDITVLPPPKQCKLNKGFKSTINLATGSLSMSEQLFATQGGNSATAVSLSYDSLDPRVGPLGAKWSHNYDIALVQNDDGSVVLREGHTRTYYKLINGVYVAETGDYSTLVKTSNTFTLTYKEGGTKTFNSIGQITAITDIYGNSLAFAYDVTGKLTSVTDPTWRVTSFVYDTVNRLSKIIDPAGNNYTFGYDGNLINAVTRPDNSQWQYTYYDAKGFMHTKTDPMNKVTTYEYDAKHRIQSGTDSEGTKSVDHPTDTTTVKNSSFTEDDGGIWDYTFDSHTGNVTSENDPYGNITSYYYNADRTVRAKTETFDIDTMPTTFYTYDIHGNVLTQTDPVDLSKYPGINPATVNIASLAALTPPIKTAISYTYDYANNDQVASSTDQRGSTATATTYQYTVENGYKVTRVTDPDAHVTTTRYYSDGTFKGSIKDVTDANQQVTSYTYYPDTPANRTAAVVGLLYEAAGPDGVITRYTSYNKNGNPLEIKTIGTDNRELHTVQMFDGMNRLKKITRYASGLPDNVTEYYYDNYGNRNYQKDPEGKETNFLYDGKGHVTKVTDAQQHETQYFYGGTGGTSCTSCGGGGGNKLTAVTDAKLQTTGFEYDLLGHLVLETDPLQKKIRYTYYDHGKVREEIDATTAPGNVLINYYYDNLGRLTKKHYADNSEESFTYDPKGRLETAANANIGYTFTYYDNGWLKSVTDSNGKAIKYDQYDGIGQKKLVTYFSGTADQRQVTYEYDPANMGRIKTITSAAGTFTFDYDKFGRRYTLAYPNGINSTYLYDDLNRLTSLTYSGGTGLPVYGYTHDQAGNRKTRTGTNPESYDYDEVYRLKQATSGTVIKNYTYDAVGNRQSGPGAKDSAYQYDAANRMTSGRLFNYLYDNSGNQITRTIPNVTDKGWTLTWDYENRLVKMEQSKGSAEKRTVTFKYDPMGSRIEKKLVATVNGVTKTTVSNYVYEGGNIVLEMVTDSDVTTKIFYTHGQGTDEHLALERNGQYFFYHADGLGSATAISDQSKSVVQSYVYDSFGMAKVATGFTNSYTYTGREWDKETGLYYYRARYYDPMEGRFISKDPIGFKGGINIYAYVGNNPINLIDPLGYGPIGMCQCLYYGYKIDKFGEECKKEIPDSYEGIIKFISKYATNGSLETAIINCTCKKAGPSLCAKWLQSCMTVPYAAGPKP